MEWLPDVIREVVAAADPLKVVLFGSVARGEHEADSDIDLLVILPSAPVTERRAIRRRILAAMRVPVPVDVVVTDPAEIARRGHLKGWMLYSALHSEGVVLYERAA
ncbi:MAG: nucleotidyltransferase domain-containing protein [Egibacteraceae bacterium]